MFFGNSDELEQEIEQKKEEINKLEEEKESLEAQLESSEEKRKKLARQKQEAEEKLNRLKDKLESRKTEEETKETKETEFQRLSFKRAKKLIDKLASIQDEDLVTIYSQGDFELDNFVEKKLIEEVANYDEFILFTDNGFFDYLIRTRPFYAEEITVDEIFDTQQIEEFIWEEKIWVTVSAGEAHIYREQNGEIEKVEDLKTRIESQHGKGGFSQGRFERKRDQQIEEFSELVEEKIGELDNEDIYLVGEKRICKEIEGGEYLGGFDDNRKTVDALYQFRFKKLLTEQS